MATMTSRWPSQRGQTNISNVALKEPESKAVTAYEIHACIDLLAQSKLGVLQSVGFFSWVGLTSMVRLKSEAFPQLVAALQSA